MSDTRAVIEDFFARRRAGDRSVVDLFADEMEWVAPGHPKYIPWAGVHTRGGEALLESFDRMFLWNVTVGESKLIVEGEDAVWVGLDVTHTLADPGENPQSFTTDVVVYFTVRDGKIVRMRGIDDVTGLTLAFYPEAVDDLIST